MKLVLLERVENLGVMGEVVSVRPGFARNFLLPQGKALRANEGNMARFEAVLSPRATLPRSFRNPALRSSARRLICMRRSRSWACTTSVSVCTPMFR